MVQVLEETVPPPTWPCLALGWELPKVHATLKILANKIIYMPGFGVTAPQAEASVPLHCILTGEQWI